MPFSYANPTSGPSAGGIGWFNFGNLTLNPGDSLTGLSGTLQDGSVVTFDMTYNYVSGQPRTFVAVPTPVFPGTPFGAAGYTGISGNVALYSNFNFSGPGVNSFTIKNIVVKDSVGNPINNYTVVLADSETTNIDEVWDWNTNGGVWNFLALLGNNPPTITGLGTQDVKIISTMSFPEITQAAYVLTSQSPTQLIITSTESTSGRQAFTLGFALTKLTLQKDIGQRIDASDQFVLNIAGTPNAQATTTGASNGIQTPVATIYATPAQTYTLSESMAAGSASALNAYTQLVSGSNATPAGTIPSVGDLPLNFTPALGDDVTYTVINAAPQVFTKVVDKAYADVGEILTYTVTIENPNDFAVTNVQFSDATPSGTVYIGNLNVSVPYTGSDPASGLVIPTIAAASSVTISWQVQVNMFPPIPNPVPNYANVIVPEGSSGMSNVVTTQVNTAFVSINKMVDKAFATVNDILTYTFLLHNAGNVPATNVVITDVLPSGTTFVPGSLVGAIGTPPTLTLLSAIPSLGDAVVSFQVKISPTLPSPNPIINGASINYTYTVDPAKPNGVSKSNVSNQVTTLVNDANIAIVKSVDKAYAGLQDVLTYTLVVSNTGNVEATNVIVQDVLPAGITYIPGTLTGASGTPANMVVSTPIAPNGTTTISFQVQVGANLPILNPIINQAEVTYQFTIDPNDPDGASGTQVSNEVPTLIRNANLAITKQVDHAYANVNDVLTYTLLIKNNGNTAANNITIQDLLPSGTTFINGSLVGATGTPPLLALATSLQAGESQQVSFQVQIASTLPIPNPLLNDATTSFTYTIDPNTPDGASGTDNSNVVSTLVNTAVISVSKAVDKAYAKPGDTLTYTLTLYNGGNVPANQVVLHDILPSGVSFVPGSLTGATGTPPTLTLPNPIGAKIFVTISFQVLIASSYHMDQIDNAASATYSYTVDPAHPNAITKETPSNMVTTIVREANVSIIKSVDKKISYIKDVLTYQIALTNNGNVPANNVIVEDELPNGLLYVDNSLQANVPVTKNGSQILITSAIAPKQTVVITFKASVVSMPNPNPIVNTAVVMYQYILDPNNPAISSTTESNPVNTLVFRYPYPQQITDIIESVALQEAALAAIANAEGAKIQTIVSQQEVSSQTLLCLNKSVNEMLESIALLEMILKQKVSVVDCQIDGTCK